MSLHYDPPSGRYSTRIPPGTAALRAVLREAYGFTRTEVVRDRSRCQRTRSEHCDCRGIDVFTTNISFGKQVMADCIRVAGQLGIQSVIFADREWGFGKWYERHRAKRDHYDHVHIGLNNWAAQNLTEQMCRDAFRKPSAPVARRRKRMEFVKFDMLGTCYFVHNGQLHTVYSMTHLRALTGEPTDAEAVKHVRVLTVDDPINKWPKR